MRRGPSDDPGSGGAGPRRETRDQALREAFDRLSTDYDARFPRIIPRYVEFHETIVQRIVEHSVRGDGVLVELGCGTGELSRRLLQAVPGLRLHCIDLVPAMIEQARAKLAPWGGRVTFAVGNFLTSPLPPGATGAVSALAVHHLGAAEKRALFQRLRGALAPGALFVLGDAVTGESELYTDYYMRRWVDHMRSSGMDEDEIRAVLADHEENDRFSSLDEQLRWLRDAGFDRVECLWKHFLLVVIAAEKPLEPLVA